jgi:hypothetical protein
VLASLNAPNSRLGDRRRTLQHFLNLACLFNRQKDFI